MIEQYYDFSIEQLALIEKFYQIHLDATLNLTAIKDREDFFVKHVLDSFLMFTEKNKMIGKTVIARTR
jgi:16S rRNA (guanine527-N7)-methyltransferase